MSSHILLVILFSMLPIVELRLGIPYGVAQGLNPWIAFLYAFIGNIIVIPIVFFFLDYLHKHFMKIRYYERLFSIYANWLVARFRNNRDKTWPYIAFFAFVALPLPGTGAYTGCLLSWLLGMRRLRSYVSVILGIVVDGTIVTLTTIGVIRLF